MLPPEIDRSLALTEYDAGKSSESGPPPVHTVLEDLATLPFLSDRRVVVIREADAFVTMHRRTLETYLERPAPTGTLVLECRTFPKTTRLFKIAASVGGISECEGLRGAALLDFVVRQASDRGKRFQAGAAERLIDLVGNNAGLLCGETEKLTLYVGKRRDITPQDVADLVGLSREEKIFAAVDAAAAGQTADALRLWHHVLATEPAAIFMVLGGLAFKLRQWLEVHEQIADGAAAGSLAWKAGYGGRPGEFQQFLRHLSPSRLRRALAAVATLDAQVKVGLRSIETGVELLLLRLAAAAR